MTQQTHFPVLVQFSGGSPKEYPYLVPRLDAMHVAKGMRVVVPTKMKDDGTVSLSIATITDPIPEIASAEALALLKPIVCLIDLMKLAEVTLACRKLDGFEVGVAQ